MDNTTQTPGGSMNMTPKKSSNMVLPSIIVIIIIALGIWAFTKYMPSSKYTMEQENAMEQEMNGDYATAQSNVSSSDELTSLESDVNATDVEGVDAGVDSEFGDK